MNAQLKSVPPLRLSVSARYEHETVEFKGNVFDFIDHIMREQLSGVGTFTVSHGTNFFGLTFDMRSRKPVDSMTKPD